MTIDASPDGQLNGIAIKSVKVDTALRWLVLAVTFLVCLIGAMLRIRGNPLELILGEDNRYSNSKLQMALWFWALIATYLASFYLRVVKGGCDFSNAIGIQPHLLLLSGMSALTFGGAKGYYHGQDNPDDTEAFRATEPLPRLRAK